jgi:hypothetical protein
MAEERTYLCCNCSNVWVGAPASSCPFCEAKKWKHAHDDLARALFIIRRLTIRGRGDAEVARIACNAVRHLDETPLFEAAEAAKAVKGGDHD